MRTGSTIPSSGDPRLVLRQLKGAGLRLDDRSGSRSPAPFRRRGRDPMSAGPTVGIPLPSGCRDPRVPAESTGTGRHQRERTFRNDFVYMMTKVAFRFEFSESASVGSNPVGDATKPALKELVRDSGGGAGRFAGRNSEPETAELEPPERLELTGVVETALVEALTLAARAGRWELVGQIAGELSARREHGGEVLGPVELARRRKPR
jgi:hypothetical protein